MPTPGRSLLPTLRRDAFMPLPAPGEWTVVAEPAALAALEPPPLEPAELTGLARAVANPWGRLLLFRDAMRHPGHPARAMVQNELLDALELVWSAYAQSLRLEVWRRALDDAGADGPPAVREYASVLRANAPRVTSGPGASGEPLAELEVLWVDGRPLLGSSPCTLLFTAADAADPAYPHLFGYARGAAPRPLRERPFTFQRYVATVLLPQVRSLDPGGGGQADVATLREVAAFLEREVMECRREAGSNARLLEDGPNVRLAVVNLHLQEVCTVAGITLYKAVGELPSRWALRSPRDAGPRPLVIYPGRFDGWYGEGYPPAVLPGGLETLDRSVLPGTRARRPWVTPEHDWLADEVLVLSDPLEAENVHGTGAYHGHPSLVGPPFGGFQIALPLRAEFFRWFTPADVERMLTVEVSPTLEVAVQLAIPVGTDERPETLLVPRRYTREQVRLERIGPQLLVWPSFAADDWHHYAVFRLDRVPATADPGSGLSLVAYESGGQSLRPLHEARRSDVATTYAYDRPVEVLELHAAAGGGARSTRLGVVLPRHRALPPGVPARWSVGVDVGAAHTTLAVRREEAGDGELFGSDRVVLALTRPGADMRYFASACFLPLSIAAEPFPTRVAYLPEVFSEPGRNALLVALNVPFSWLVPIPRPARDASPAKPAKSDEDVLAWGFLRVLVMVVLAHAREHGVAPWNVTFEFSRSDGLSRAEEDVLRERWRRVLESVAAPGTSPSALRAGSVLPRLGQGAASAAAMLAYFAVRQDVSIVSGPVAVMDVGAASSRLVLVVDGRVAAVDVAGWGGEALTGARPLSRSGAGFTNPFVAALARWAARGELPSSRQEPLHAFAEEGEDALAFSYLARADWSGRDLARATLAMPERQGFQVAVIYWLAALFHNAGLRYRAANGSDAAPLLRMLVGGNGSRFAEWFTLRWGLNDQNPIRNTLVEVFRAAAGGSAPQTVEVLLSPSPKQEVAHGLVAARSLLDVTVSDVNVLVGESVRVETESGQPREYQALDAVLPNVPVDARAVGQIRWAQGQTQIEAFHAALLEAARRHLLQLGGRWRIVPGELADLFARMRGDELEFPTRMRLERAARMNEARPGNLFFVEAAVVLDALFDLLFSMSGRK